MRHHHKILLEGAMIGLGVMVASVLLSLLVVWIIGGKPL